MAHVINDSLFEDTVYYYDNNNCLIRKDFYKEGKIEGLSTDYHCNGIPKIQTNYSNGYKNGINAYFDTLGNCYYKDNYYFDLPVGAIIFYENRNPKKFYFTNLQNETLLEIDYQTWKGVNDIVHNCINYTCNIQRQDSTREFSLLLYVITPPKFSFDYSILKAKRKTRNDFSVVATIQNDKPFQRLVLPILHDSLYYSIRLSIFDSIINKKTIIDKEVW